MEAGNVGNGGNVVESVGNGGSVVGSVAKVVVLVDTVEAVGARVMKGNGVF